MGLIFLIIFSFFVEKHKIQFPQLLVLEFYVWFTVVITHCRVKQVYPLIKLHLWCPRFKKTAICGAIWGFAISSDGYFFI